MSDVSDELMRGKTAFLRGDPLPIQSASAAFTYAYRTEEHIRTLEAQLASAEADRDAAHDAWVRAAESIREAERARDELRDALESMATYDDAGLTYCGRCHRGLADCAADLRRGCVGRIARAALAASDETKGTRDGPFPIVWVIFRGEEPTWTGTDKPDDETRAKHGGRLCRYEPANLIW